MVKWLLRIHWMMTIRFKVSEEFTNLIDLVRSPFNLSALFSSLPFFSSLQRSRAYRRAVIINWKVSKGVSPNLKFFTCLKELSYKLKNSVNAIGTDAFQAKQCIFTQSPPPPSSWWLATSLFYIWCDALTSMQVVIDLMPFCLLTKTLLLLCSAAMNIVQDLRKKF